VVIDGARSSLEVVMAEEAVRLVDRTMASDEQRLAWIEQIHEVERRAVALKGLLVAGAEAGSAMRSRGTRLADWLARSGQQTPGQV
jgi:hypothetical protein